MDDFRPRSRQPLRVPNRSASPAARTYPPERPTDAKIEPPQQLPTPQPLSHIDLNLPVKNLALPRKKSRKWLWWVAIPGALLAILVAGAITALAWYNDALKSKSTDETPVTIQIESGASIDQVATELEQKGIIKSALAFSVYMKLGNRDVIKTGSYLLAPNQSVEEIVSWLNEGRVSTRRVTILPGQTLKQIRATLIEDGFSEAAVDAALKKTYDHKLLANKPDDATLEGYIFPETYFVTTDSTPEQLLIRTFDEFEKKIEENGLRAKLRARGFDLYEGITLASIVGKEVAKPDEQKQVAQVFETRLERDMMLGSDPTYQYAADMLGVERAVNIDSPYNTRIHKGLPPGPIANFNLSALIAVGDPAPGDYLFFVAGDDGVTHFSHTFEEHQQKVQKYCQKLCAKA
jgi:UPF0755 protein